MLSDSNEKEKFNVSAFVLINFKFQKIMHACYCRIWIQFEDH